MTGVLVIDDHTIALKGCRVFEDAGVQIVLEAGDLVSGYGFCCLRHPDVVVIDLKMGPQDLRDLSLIRRIRLRDSGTRILVCGMHDNPAIVTSALEAGASGYLLKDRASEELARAVEQVRAGKPYPSAGRHTGRCAARQSITRCVGEFNTTRDPDVDAAVTGKEQGSHGG